MIVNEEDLVRVICAVLTSACEIEQRKLLPLREILCAGTVREGYSAIHYRQAERALVDMGYAEVRGVLLHVTDKGISASAEIEAVLLS